MPGCRSPISLKNQCWHAPIRPSTRCATTRVCRAAAPHPVLKDRQTWTVLPLAFFELVRFLRMQSGAGRISLLSIELRQAAVDNRAARIEIELASILVD